VLVQKKGGRRRTGEGRRETHEARWCGGGGGGGGGGGADRVGSRPEKNVATCDKRAGLSPTCAQYRKGTEGRSTGSSRMSTAAGVPSPYAAPPTPEIPTARAGHAQSECRRRQLNWGEEGVICHQGVVHPGQHRPHGRPSPPFKRSERRPPHTADAAQPPHSKAVRWAGPGGHTSLCALVSC